MSRIITKINKESLTTKLTLIIVGLTAGSALLIPATYASFHPVTTGEIADNTIQSRDISNTLGVASVDIRDGQVGSVDIGTGQVASVDIGQGQVRTGDIANDAIRPNIQIRQEQITAAPNTGTNIGVDCPAGTLVTGGGYYANPGIEVSGSHPADLDTWRVVGFNGGLSEESLWGYAVCMGPMP
jgi:hypothetical protein